MKINDNSTLENKLYPIYLTGLLLILALPFLAISPLFFPPEWGKSIAFRMILSIILFLFIWQITSKSQLGQGLIEKYNSQKKMLWLLIALFLALFLSTLFSSDILFSTFASPHRSGGFVDFSFYILLPVILFFVVKNSDWKKLWNFAFLIGDFTVIFAAIQYFNLLPKFLIAYEGRPPSTLSNPTLFAIYLTFLIFPLLAFIIHPAKSAQQTGGKGLLNWIKEKSKNRVFYISSFLLFSFGLFISGSRSAYLGIIAGAFYFFFFYPINREENSAKKINKAKTAVSMVLALIILAVILINIFPQSFGLINNNQRLSFIFEGRLSIKSAFEDLVGTRLVAWQTFSKAVMQKPLLGWGPENQQIGFDKYYEPSLSTLINIGQNWWDRAHNIFLDLAVSYGVPFLIIYISIFGFLFWKLQKTKKTNLENKITAHAVQSLFLAYFIALLFGFDSITTYIILFFIIGYSLYLTSPNAADLTQASTIKTADKISFEWLFLYKKRKIIISFLFIILVIFLYQYNLKPLIINAEINSAEKLPCNKKLPALEKIFSQKSFLDSFLRLKYVDDVQNCVDFVSSNEAEYVKKSIEVLKYSAKVQPDYTRTWLLLGQFNTVLMAAETDLKAKNTLLQESEYYFKKAQELSPKRQEIFSGLAETYFVAGDYQKMKENSEKCVLLNPDIKFCYWYLGLSQILLGDEPTGEKSIELAKQKGYLSDSQVAYNQLALAYTINKSYKKLIPIYDSLLAFDGSNIQYRASLASIYKELGDYKNARAQALKIIELNPEMKNEVDEFLKTLSY